MKKGDSVWFRGRFARYASNRGVIEDIISEAERSKMGVYGRIGVRLENGNFHWATEAQLTERKSRG